MGCNTVVTGKVQVAFPADFDGIVTAKTSNAKIHLSDSMKRNSMIVPNPPESSSDTVCYRIRPHDSSTGSNDKPSLTDENDVLDKCNIQTSNSSISFGYLNEVDDLQSKSSGKKKESSSCLIS